MASCLSKLAQGHARYGILLLVVWLVFQGKAWGADDSGMWQRSVAIPEHLAGNWAVTRVLVDLGASRRLHYQADDPRLLGRTVLISPENIHGNLPESRQCVRPRVLFQRIGIDRLLHALLAGTGEGNPEHLPSEYDLPFEPRQTVNSGWISCAEGKFGPKQDEADTLADSLAGARTWVIELGRQQMVLAWYDRTILLLDRLPASPQAIPSFSCAQAGTAAEKAICSSFSLAAFDNSVASAYKLLQQTCRGALRCLVSGKKQQASWLARRDQCGADQGCLTSTMQQRIDQLMESAAAP